MSSVQIDVIVSTYVNELVNFEKTGIESNELKEFTAKLRQIRSTGRFPRSIPTQAAQLFASCTTCSIFINAAIHTLRLTIARNETFGENAKNLLANICSGLKIQTHAVCTGLFNLNWPALYYILQNSKVDAQTICSALPISTCQVKQPEFNWKLNINNQSPITTIKEVPKKTDDYLTILHLTDIHYDRQYVASSLADCQEPMCCRSSSSGKWSENGKAGYWGDYRHCDLPLYTIKDAMRHINGTHNKIDAIYYTGDSVAHDIWSTTAKDNMDNMKEINDLIANSFEGIKVYPCIGNHDMHPNNLFGPENVPTKLQTNWFYKYLWNEWSRWLPSSTKETIEAGGYYTILHQPKLRIIALNNNDCNLYNWWIYYEDTSSVSISQLNWLHDTLLAAEKAGEFVHILAHIPSGDSECWTVWAREYNRVIQRFSYTISGIFNGHTHFDEFEVHYSKEGQAFGISWNGGSLTPHFDKNPNYRLYDVEKDTYQVFDHSTWIFNLNKANKYGKESSPEWFEEYKFSKFTTDLSPAGIDALLTEMSKNPDKLREYWKVKITSADPQLAVGCNKDCLLDLICRLATSVFNEKSRCNELQENLKKSNILASAFSVTLSDEFPNCEDCQTLIREVKTKITALTDASDPTDITGFMASEARLIFADKCHETNPSKSLNVCLKLYDRAWPYIQVVNKITDATEKTICNMFPGLQVCDLDQPAFDWNIEVDSGEPAPKKTSTDPQTKSNLNIIHMSELHYDPNYVSGSLAVCDEGICCHEHSEDGSEPKWVRAGLWGSYFPCNTPSRTIESAFKDILANNPKIDYIYMTGNFLSQNEFGSTPLSVKEEWTDVRSLIMKHFNAQKVFPVLGNHDTYPTNIFNFNLDTEIPSTLNNNWIYEEFWLKFKNFLPTTAKETILKGGYYTVSPQTGFRIIALNNMDCNVRNWWIYVNGEKVSKPQLQWMHDTLLSAEKAGESVHILAHIPSGNNDCTAVWSRNFNRIIDRFQNIITGIFSGYTKYDAPQVHYSESSTPMTAMAVTWNGGSVNTNAYINSNYKVNTVDPDTFEILQQTSFYFDLVAANAISDKEPKWIVSYNLNGKLTPAAMNKLLTEISENPDYLMKVWRYQLQMADASKGPTCDEICQNNFMCNLATYRYGEYTVCNQFLSELSKTVGYLEKEASE